jgi:hypothetical protein
VRAELASLPSDFRAFGKSAARDRGITYELICFGVAEDESILDLMGLAPREQRRPNLLLAAVHYLLLSGAEHELALSYRTVVDERADPLMETDGPPPAALSAEQGARVVAAFLDFASSHREAISHLMATRSTQTNEVGRCTALLPALALQSARLGQPLALLDVGAAAGLNLQFDRYAYQYVRPDGTSLAAGPFDSEVQLQCELREGTLPDLGALQVPSRYGLDLSPIDVDDTDGALWLLACQWPDDLARFQRVRGALSVARSQPDRPRVQQGDMLHDLNRVVEQIPEQHSVCIFHSWVAAYLDPTEQAQLSDEVQSIARQRRVTWIFAENPYEVPGLPTPAAVGHVSPKEATALVQITFDHDQVQPVRIADIHHHGRWMSWYGA